jgi:hypothetical protein
MSKLQNERRDEIVTSVLASHELIRGKGVTTPDAMGRAFRSVKTALLMEGADEADLREVLYGFETELAQATEPSQAHRDVALNVIRAALGSEAPAAHDPTTSISYNFTPAESARQEDDDRRPD